MSVLQRLHISIINLQTIILTLLLRQYFDTTGGSFLHGLSNEDL